MPIVVLPESLVSEAFTWVEPDGTEHTLNRAAGYAVQYGMNGRWSMPISYAEDKVPLQSGTVMRQVNVHGRDLDVPIVIYGTTAAELYDRLRALVRWVDASRPDGPGALVCTAPDGEQRTLTCYGLIEAGESQQERTRVSQRVALVLRAPDPFWYAADEQSEMFVLSDTGYPFFPFEFPFRVPSSTVLGAVTIENEGDAAAWPVITITGPGQVPTVRNRDTGEAIGVNIELEAGEQIIIDTRPGVKTVTDPSGTNLFSLITPNSSLWSLPPGFTQVQVEMTGASSASSVVITWTPRYWTP